MKPASTLLVIGGLIVLAALVSACVSYERDKGRVAEFYQRNVNAAVLPPALQPESVRPIEVLALIVGGAVLAIGIARSRAAGREGPDRG